MTDFTLTLADLGNTSAQNIETLFAQANGILGVRASLPIPSTESSPGSFINGFYESHEIVYGENAYGYAKNHQTMVKLFDLRTIEIAIDGESEFSLLEQDLRLEMATGILSESYRYATKSGKKIQIDLESLASHANRAVYAQKISVTALNFSGAVKIGKKARHIKPEGISEFDPRLKESSADLQISGNRYRTKNSQLDLFVKFDDFDETLSLAESQTFTFTQLYHLSRLNDFSDVTYDTLKMQQTAIFKDFWASSDIEIVGDDKLQKGIRFNLYHLFNSAGRDGHTNFAAKGLTGEGYEGHYFWDTEMYLLPFFIYTQPEIAKSLLTFRANILPQAQKRAAELEFAGALFAWRTINGEETSAYYPAGTAQLHINADIAYAFELYDNVTGDADFIAKNRKVIYEIARFWMSYGFMSARGFEIHEVTGPDEYTALVNNNFYTNKMVQNTFYYAAKLAVRFDENLDEALKWSTAANKMYFGYDEKRQLTQQDDSFLDKEPWEFDKTPTENYPLLLHYHPMKIYKHQVLKQADTILAHMLFSESKEQIARDYDFYEPLTTHDSSLSRAVYGVVASKIDRNEQAYDFFKAAATMDLDDRQGNASHGIHAANMGGSWLGLIYGFAGLQLENGQIKTSNHLPKAIKSLRFNLLIRGKMTEIFIKND
ncbi:hypothetical protein Hs30E_01050 [Lactococcus hodotermopsidis]|uniref:Maltose phosphorylase n=1 Tax=Pseudolactococcus hodotermopsidis TaxID=2709157 RepID=A0A6A0BB16_9LACT|nr:glycoside hydrolase family 65 protein [Lactococcus hodotermopsidis]GFH41554.1 hypothetical protein Hs30E_01050 [Lactococcus hodotermopsidis]